MAHVSILISWVLAELGGTITVSPLCTFTCCNPVQHIWLWSLQLNTNKSGCGHMSLLYRKHSEQMPCSFVQKKDKTVTTLWAATYMCVMILCRKTPSTSSMNMLTLSSEPTWSHDPNGPNICTCSRKVEDKHRLYIEMCVWYSVW